MQYRFPLFIYYNIRQLAVSFTITQNAAPVGLEAKTAVTKEWRVRAMGYLGYMGYLGLRGILGFLRFIRVVEDFGYMQSLHLCPICKYATDDEIHYLKLGRIVYLIQPKGWSRKYGTKAYMSINQGATGE